MPDEDKADLVAAQIGGLSQDQLKHIGSKITANLDTANLSTFWSSLGRATPAERVPLFLQETIQRLPEDQQTGAVVKAIEHLPQKQQQQIVQGVTRAFEQPSGPTRDRLWLIVVVSFCVVFVGSATALAVCVFSDVPKDQEAKASPELLLAMFTSVVGFLAGLFVPSPAASKNGTG